jgi:hypothetical protein
MLEIKPVCENCSKLLSYDSTEAMVCTFECTFCKACVENVLFNVCPNCGGGFEKRPVRPSRLLEKYPPTKTEYIKPVDKEAFKKLLDQYKEISPEKR